jgi:hypothetical protein
MAIAVAWLASASVAVADVTRIAAAGNAWHVAAGDTDGDRRDELVYACYDGRVIARRGDGDFEQLWEYPTGAFPFDMSVADLDGDGRAETLVASADGRLYVIGHDGKLLWTYAAMGPLYQVAVLSVGQQTRVLAGGVDRDLYMLDASGALLARSPRRHVVRLIGTGDLDGDGQDEIVLGYHPGKIEALGATSFDVIWRQRLMDRGDSVGRNGTYRPYSMTVADLDGDSRCEIILGGSFYNENELRVLDATGPLLWKHRKWLDLKGAAGGSHTATVVMDVDGDELPEIVALNANRLVLFDRNGKVKSKSDAPTAFANIASSGGDRHPRSILLASSPNGDDQIYRVRFGEHWRRAFAGIQPRGRIKQVSDNLAAIRRQLRAIRNDRPDVRPTLHFITSGAPNTPAKLRSHFDVIRGFRQRFPYPHVTFAIRLTAATDDLAGEAPRAVRRSRIALSPAVLVTLLRMCEVAGIPFVLDVGHGCQSFVSLDSVERIVRACPRTCLGFLSSEDDGSPEELGRFMTDYWYPLMDICKHSGKKAFLVEKHAWWMVIPAMKRFASLADGTYADVLVPSVEDTNSRCPELNLAARTGLFSCGAVREWAARSVHDEPCWSRYWQTESIMAGHPFLRRQLVQALLGATYFDYRYDYRSKSDAFGLNAVGEDSIGILIDLLGKGLLIPPAADDQAGLAAAPIWMREPDRQFVRDLVNLHNNDDWDPRRSGNAGPFGRLEGIWGAAPCEADSVSRIFFGQHRKGLGFIPPTGGAFPLIVPLTAAAGAARGNSPAWSTNGADWYLDGVCKPDVSTSDVAREMDAANADRPIVIEGDAFARVQELGGIGYRVTIVDSGYLDPADREVTIRCAAVGDEKSASDALTGQSLESRDGAVLVVVPAGGFRIIDLAPKRLSRTAEGQRRDSDDAAPMEGRSDAEE